MSLDDTDKLLLEHLQQDGAMAYQELGNLVGLSASSVNERLRKMRAKGVLRRLTAEIDPSCLGLDMLAFVLVVVESDESGFKSAMSECPEVLECHHITGEFSYLLKLRLENASALERFLATRLKAQKGIGRTHTLIALSSAKETHVLHPPPRLEARP